MLKNLWNLLRTNSKKQEYVIVGHRCYLRQLTPVDAYELSALLLRSRTYWSTFEPMHNLDYYSERVQAQKLADLLKHPDKMKEILFGIFDKETNVLVGQISLYGFKPKPFLSALIGYGLDEAATKKGYMQEAIQLLIKEAFERLELNRIEAYIAPNNTASIRVAQRGGLQYEGLLKELLYINGKWCDHALYAITKSQYNEKGSNDH
jgi:[ribosomal protein S5]-alanine N-acetyltransferase